MSHTTRISLCIRILSVLAMPGTLLLAIDPTPAFAQCGGMRGGGNSAGRDFGIGAGIGLGIGISREIIQSQRNNEVDRGTKQGKANKKDNKTAKKPENNKPTEKPKEPVKAADPKAPTEEKLVYTPPVFPKIEKLENCDDCNTLWQSIVWYERIIAEDMKKLVERKNLVIDSIAELAKFKVELAKATESYDKAYYTRMIEITDGSIGVNEKMNADLEKRIDEATKILKDRIAQYQKCFDSYCTKPSVSDAPPLAPPSIPVAPPPTIPVSTPPLAPPEQPALKTPPDPNQKICGPNITDLVLNALREMKEEFEANPGKQSAACHALMDPNTHGYAWDIAQLSPSTSPKAGYQYDPGSDTWVGPQTDPKIPPVKMKPWFTSYSDLCAIPRPVCGATVEFLGTCQHAQVVNYTQWGMMMALCGGFYSVLGEVAHAAWNYKTYGSTAPGAPQQNMVKVGIEYKAELDKDPKKGKGNFIPNITEIKKRLQERDKLISHPEQDCELKCELTAEQRQKLLAHDFSFTWVGLKSPYTQTPIREVPTVVREQLGK